MFAMVWYSINFFSSTTYEVYIEAVNEHGVGEESSRIVFRTASRTISDLNVTDRRPQGLFFYSDLINTYNDLMGIHL